MSALPVAIPVSICVATCLANCVVAVSAKGRLINKKIVSLSALVADWEKSGFAEASLTVVRLAAANPATVLSRWQETRLEFVISGNYQNRSGFETRGSAEQLKPYPHRVRSILNNVRIIKVISVVEDITAHVRQILQNACAALPYTYIFTKYLNKIPFQ